jgi:outer membrane protein OmpA-like peptidoglycan-associated protein
VFAGGGNNHNGSDCVSARGRSELAYIENATLAVKQYEPSRTGPLAVDAVAGGVLEGNQMRFSRLRTGFCAASALLVSVLSGAARAEGLALNRFDPAPAGDRMFGVPSPFAAGHLTPHVMLLADYAHNPLKLYSVPTDTDQGAIVKHQLYLHLNVSLALWNRVNLDVSVPVAVYQNGDDPTAGGQTFASPSSAQFGDLRFGLRVRLLGEYHDPFQLAVGGYVWVPTGANDSFVSSGEVRGLPQLLLGGRIAERVVWSAATGPQIQGKSTFGNVDQGIMYKWGAGLGFLLLDNRHLQIGPEAYGAVTLRDVQKHTTNAEILLDVRYRIVDDVEIAAGAGPGLTSGIGTPDLRALFSVAYTPEQKQAPIVLPQAPPPPPPDRDGDGILDADDACPDVKGIADDDPKKNGCPPPEPVDTDGDGIFDPDDACVDVKGVADEDPKKNGCPPPKDTDGDGIFDPDDACPAEKGPPDEDRTKNGCPKAVRVVENEIVILEQVQFDTGKATIKQASDELLNEVAEVLTQHPEMTKVEVQGHTDNRGTAAMNKKLSQARADAVKKALVQRGVSGDRLTTKGYGPDKPIDDNGTDEGRQKNRRVQFVIVEKQAKETL